MGEHPINMASMATGLIVSAAVLLAPGCGMFGGGNGPVVVAETEDGEKITWDELDALTRAFADRQVGLLYSVTRELAGDDATADERLAARTLLADGATNIYNIASAENVFNRVLDFAVVAALLHRQWGEQGRAEEVFGAGGERLVEAFADMDADARALAARVLDDEQLGTLESLVDSWHGRNPQVDEVSFVRFAQFATGETRPDAQGLLGIGSVLFAEIGTVGEAVDDAARVADRALYRAERAGTLLRWQVAAAKADAMATPEIGNAFEQISGLRDQLDALPGDIGAEVRAVLTGLDERLPEVNNTIDNATNAIETARGTIDDADALAASVRNASESVRETMDAASTLFEESGSGNGEEFDIAEYERTAEDVALAAERVETAIASARDLLGSADLRQGAGEIGAVMDETLEAATEQSEEVLNAFFWRVAALIGLFFVLLAVYRALSIWMTRRYGPGPTERRGTAPGARTGAYH